MSETSTYSFVSLIGYVWENKANQVVLIGAVIVLHITELLFWYFSNQSLLCVVIS